MTVPVIASFAQPSEVPLYGIPIPCLLWKFFNDRIGTISAGKRKQQSQTGPLLFNGISKSNGTNGNDVRE